MHIWARNTGKRIPVRIPPGCLLVQAGKQLEWFTGGLIKGECGGDDDDDDDVGSIIELHRGPLYQTSRIKNQLLHLKLSGRS